MIFAAKGPLGEFRQTEIIVENNYAVFVFEYNGGYLQYYGLNLTLSRAVLKTNVYEYNGAYLQCYGLYLTPSRAVLKTNVFGVSADNLICAVMPYSCASTTAATSLTYNRAYR